MKTDEEIVAELRELLKDELVELRDHLRRENLDSEDDDYIDGSWIYDMYRATDMLDRDVPWEYILRILL